MNTFDLSIISFFNQLVHHSLIFDTVVKGVSNKVLLTSIPITSMLWWSWFERNERQITNRKFVISIIISCIGACIIYYFLRELRLFIPFRLRPQCNPEIVFQLSYSMTQIKDACRESSSSFPSGHAAILFAVSVGLIYISRLTGVLCLIYSTIICLSRIFTGAHYPTDIIAGALIGVGLFYLVNLDFVENSLTRQVMKWSNIHPPSYYAFFFIISLEIAEFFRHSQDIFRGVSKLLKSLWG